MERRSERPSPTAFLLEQPERLPFLHVLRRRRPPFHRRYLLLRLAYLSSPQTGRNARQRSRVSSGNCVIRFRQIPFQPRHIPVRNVIQIVVLWASQRPHPKLLKQKKHKTPSLAVIDIPYGVSRFFAFSLSLLSLLRVTITNCCYCRIAPNCSNLGQRSLRPPFLRLMTESN